MCAGVLSQYNTIASLLSQALGGGGEAPPETDKPREGFADVSGGVEKAVANLNGLLTF